MRGGRLGVKRAVCMTVCLFTLSGTAAQATASQLVVDGQPSGPRTFTPEQLAGLPQEEATRVDHGLPVTCRGVALIDLLAAAGLPTGMRCAARR